MKHHLLDPPPADSLLCDLVEAQRFLLATQQIGHGRDLRVADSLRIAGLLVKMQRSGAGDPEVAQALLSVETRILGLARLYRCLEISATQGEVDTALFLHEFCRELGASIGLSCTVVAESVSVSPTVAAQLAIAVHELTLNALKHGYRGRDGGRLYLTSCRDAEGQLCIVVSDFGGGLPDGFAVEERCGHGMALVAGAVEQVGGTIFAENDFGARFTIRVPLH